MARLSDPTAVMPTFVVDFPGGYEAQLIVNDGTQDSALDTVLISAENPAPVPVTLTLVNNGFLVFDADTPLGEPVSVTSISGTEATMGTPSPLENTSVTLQLTVAVVEGSETVTASPQFRLTHGNKSLTATLSALPLPMGKELP